MSELKPCPFCGAKATLQPFFHGLSYSWGVVCTETFAHHMTFDGTQEEVIKEWNRRVNE